MHQAILAKAWEWAWSLSAYHVIGQGTLRYYWLHVQKWVQQAWRVPELARIGVDHMWNTWLESDRIFISLLNTIELYCTVSGLELYLILTILHADSAYCFAASSPWKFVIFGSTTTKVSMYFSSPGPAGPCLCAVCVSFNERVRRIFGSSVQTNYMYMYTSKKIFEDSI